MNDQNLKPFAVGEDIRRNLNGRPKGGRNRSTVAREILSLNAKFPTHIWEKLKEQYPSLQEEMSIEEMMAIVQADKAIRKQDTFAYSAMMDSAYGRPKQEIEQSGAVKFIISPMQKGRITDGNDSENGS